MANQRVLRSQTRHQRRQDQRSKPYGRRGKRLPVPQVTQSTVDRAVNGGSNRVHGVWNFSSVELNQYHDSVLVRNLTFCPTPLTWPPRQYQDDLWEFQRKVRNHVRFCMPIDQRLPANPHRLPPPPPPPHPRVSGGERARRMRSGMAIGPERTNNRAKELTCQPHPPRVYFVRSNQPVVTPINWEEGEEWLYEQCTFLDREILAREPKPPLDKRDNLGRRERQALTELTHNTSIVMKKPDKSQGIVICDREDYIEFGLRQLSNREYYEPIPGLLAPQKALRLAQIVDEEVEAGGITKALGGWLKEGCANFRERKAYFLMKVHKPKTAWWTSRSGRLLPPGRPIISNVSTELSNAAKFTDFWLLPSQLGLGALVRDSYDFIERLHNLPPLGSKKLLLVTADVKDLYTNIDQRKAADCMISWLQHTPETGRPSLRCMAELLELQLYDNDFTFNGQWFKQVKGIAMGWNPAPTVANYYLKQLDEAILRFGPIGYYRFIDDIILIWDNERPRADLLNLQQTCTQFDSNIELIWEAPSERATFLDVEVFTRDFQGQSARTRQSNYNGLGHRVYFKPTDTHGLLHHSSCHPAHTFKGLIRSQLLRYRRLCSCDTDAYMASEILFEILVTRQYSKRTLCEIRAEVWEIPRAGLFKKNKKPRYLPGTEFLDCDSPTEEVIPLCLPYSPETASLAPLVHERWSSYTAEYPEHAPYWPKKVTIAWRKNATLGNLLVRAQLPCLPLSGESTVPLLPPP